MIPELRDHILSFLSPDSLLPPSILDLSRLLQRPTLDLLLLHRAGAPTSCLRYDWSHEDHVYSRPAWVVRVTRRELRRVRLPEYAGYRATSLMPNVTTAITNVYCKIRGHACAWETSGLFRVSILVPVSQADEEYLQAWQAHHGKTWPEMQGDHPNFLRLHRMHDEWMLTTWEELPL